MITRNGFETYQMYVSLKLYFTGKYDYFTYGKKKISSSTYQKRKEVFSFEKLSKIIPMKNMEDFFVSQFVKNKNPWIRDMDKRTYDEWKSKMKNLPNIFEEDLWQVKHVSREMLSSQNGKTPEIYKWTLSNRMNLETLIMLDCVFPFIDKHDSAVSFPFAAQDHFDLIKKYRPFVKKHYTDLYKQSVRKIFLS
jgi:hypothetical protein